MGERMDGREIARSQNTPSPGAQDPGEGLRAHVETSARMRTPAPGQPGAPIEFQFRAPPPMVWLIFDREGNLLTTGLDEQQARFHAQQARGMLGALPVEDFRR